MPFLFKNLRKTLAYQRKVCNFAQIYEKRWRIKEKYVTLLTYSVNCET